MFEGVAFLIIWAVLPFFWQMLLRVAGLSLLRLSIPSFVLAFIYAVQYLGLPILYFQIDKYRAQLVTDRWLTLQVFCYTSITITLMLAGFISGRHHFGRLNWTTTQYNMSRPVVAGGSRQTLGLAILVSICTAILLLYLSKIGIQNIAFLVVTGVVGDDLTSGAARSAMGNAFEGRYYLYKMFMRDLLPFAALALFAQYLVKRTTAVRFILLITLVITTFSLLAAIEKGPIANFIIAMFLVYVFVRREGRVPTRGLISLGLILLVVLSFSYIYFMKSDDLGVALVSLFSRAFTGSIEPGYHYLEYFPAVHDFLLGNSFPNPGNILPFEHFNLTTEVMAWTHPDLQELGVVGSMPAIYWGEMYANFGLFGILIPPLILGYGLYWLNAIMFRLQPTPLSIALIVWAMMHFKALSVTGASAFLFDTYFLAVLFSFTVLAFFAGRGVIKVRQNASQPNRSL